MTRTLKSKCYVAVVVQVLVSLVLLIVPLRGDAVDGKKNVPAVNMVSILYYGFDAEAFAGVSVDQIELVGCPFLMKTNDALNLFNSAKVSNYFDLRDVRAKVSFPNGEIYYISRDGYFVYKNKVRTIDRQQFDKKLIVVPNRRC